ncbi:MAG TPA: FixH family protein [Devosia sp.]
MSAQAKEFTGRHMWLVFGGFFGVIIAVNVGMAVVASTSWTGLVVQNSYVASQEFEDKRLAHEAQRAAGWQTRFDYEPGVATLVVVDGTGGPVDLGQVTLKVNRPVGGHDDQTVVLGRAAGGGYQAPLTLAAGVWDALVEAPDTPKGSFELHERFTAEAAK